MIYLSRWSFAQLPLPFWMTAVLTYCCVWWEALFPVLVSWRRTRAWTLWFGVSFHAGIFLTMEVGWFSIYSLCFYPVWIADRFWIRRRDAQTPLSARVAEPVKSL